MIRGKVNRININLTLLSQFIIERLSNGRIDVDYVLLFLESSNKATPNYSLSQKTANSESWTLVCAKNERDAKENVY